MSASRVIVEYIFLNLQEVITTTSELRKRHRRFRTVMITHSVFATRSQARLSSTGDARGVQSIWLRRNENSTLYAAVLMRVSAAARVGSQGLGRLIVLFGERSAARVGRERGGFASSQRVG